MILNNQGEVVYSTVVAHIGELHGADKYFVEGRKVPYLQARYKNYAGVPVVGNYRWIPALQLGLIREIKQADAFAPAQQLGILIFIIGLLVAGVMVVGVLLLARQITRPILAITVAAQKVAGGDLTVTAPVLTENEVGTLAQTFNNLTGQVAGSMTS